MSAGIAREKLLRLLNDGGRRLGVGPQVSRRNFLVASTGAAAAAGVDAATLASSEPPQFSKQGRTLQVRFKGLLWEIDAARFGDAADVDASPVGPRHRIRLSRAQYPGTNVRASFSSWIYFDGAQWRIDIDLADATSESHAADIEPPLLESWMLGEARLAFSRPARFRIAEVEVASETRHLVVGLDSRLRLSWSGRVQVDLKVARFRTVGGSLEARTGSDGLLEGVVTGPLPRAHTAVSFGETDHIGGSIALGRIGAGHRLTLEPLQPRLRLIAFSASTRRDEALTLLQGPGTIVIYGNGLSQQGGKLPLDKAVVTLWASNPRRRLEIAYAIQRKAFLFETDSFSLCIGGGSEPETLQIDHAALPIVTFPTVVTQAHVPVRGASMASIALPSAALSLQIGGSTPPRDCAAHTWLGTRALLDVPLDQATLHLQRSVDHFDLKFEFRNYKLQCHSGRTRLFERWAFAAGCAVHPNPPTLIAVFSPQHVQEQVFDPVTYPDAIKGLKFPNDLSATAIAGPSRIAMQGLNPEKGWEAGEELTIEHITDWEHLSLVVHARALPADAPLPDQMKAVHLQPWTSRADARIAILRSLVTAPGPDQTALEPVTGLIVSPDRSAWFSTPRTKPGRVSGVALWSARLRLGQNSAVRALHARRASFAFLADQCSIGNQPASQKQLHNFLATLSAQDRAELVVLMSAYAMPSLRRLLVSQDNKLGDLIDDPKGMVVRPADRLAFLSDAALPYELPPLDGIKKSIKAFQEGILLPRGYREFDLTLSAMKATLRSRWDGEPPAPLPSDPFFSTALTVQGYVHRTVWGRDALVQVAYKGFLFPLGHRAALIKVSERPFTAARQNPDLLDPRAYLIQRHYIVCSKPTKLFPALGQPFKGREFPASSVEMVTIVTPDILSVDNNAKEALNLQTKRIAGQAANCQHGERPEPNSVGRVFWPRTREGKPDDATPPNSYGHEVQFEYRIDGHPQLLRSALLFVDNAAAHDAPTMQAVVRYYEGLLYMEGHLVRGGVLPGPSANGIEARDALRVATTGGAERKYAPSLKGGETSFQTEYWVLGATGGVGAGQQGAPEVPGTVRRWLRSTTNTLATELDPSASYAMDALMEGADQPPFYPRVHRALIKMQSLDRLLGRPQGLIEVGFSNRYVVYALDASANPAEIYLDVVRPSIDLDFSGQGDAAGGVAKPNARLAAISRTTGMIGGRSLPQPAAGAAQSQKTTSALTLPAGVQATHLKYDTTAALSGRFDPAEFLGGAVADAKLLGIIPLKEVIRVVAIGMAPKLREVAEYASEALAAELPKIARIIDTTVATAVEAGNKAARQLLNNGAIPDPLQEFYPALSSRAQRLRQTCARIAETPSGTLAQDFASLAGELYESGKDFVQGLEQVAADPTPQGLAEYLKQLREAMDALQALSNPAQLRAFVLDKVHATVAGLLTDLVVHLFGTTDKELGAFDVAFGITGTEGLLEKRAAVLREIVTNPAGAVDRLRSSVIEQALPGLFVEAFSRLEAVRREAAGLLAWARSELRDEVIGLLAQGDPYLREVPAIQKLGTEFMDELARALENFNAAGTLRDGGLPKLVADLQERVRPAITKVISRHESVVRKDAIEVVKRKVEECISEVQKAKAQLEGKPQIEREVQEAGLRVLESTLAGLKRAASLAPLPSLATLVEQAVHKELDRQAQRLQTTARAALEDVLGGLASQVVAAVKPALEAGGHLIEFASRAANTALQNWCTSGAAATISDLQTLVVGDKLPNALLPTAALPSALDKCGKLLADLMAVAVPSSIPAERRVEAEALLADARRQLSQAIEQGNALLAALKDLPANPCAAPDARVGTLRVFDTLCRCRIRLLDNATSGLAAAARCQIQLLAGDARGMQLDSASVQQLDLCGRISAVLADIDRLLPTPAAISALKAKAIDIDKLGSAARAGTFAKLVDKLGEQAANAKRLLKSVALECKNTEDALRDFARLLDEQRAHMVQLVEREERRVTGFILDHLLSSLIKPETVAALNTALANAMSRTAPLIDGVYQIHNSIAISTDKLSAAIEGATEQSPLAELIAAMAGPGLAALREANAVIKKDTALTKEVSDAFSAKDSARAVAAVGKVQSEWATQEPGLIRAAQLLSRLAQSLMRGQLSALFDFNQVREQIQQHLLGLLPTRIKQTYDFDTRLEDYPSNDPIFYVNRTASAQEAPLLATAKNDLVLRTQVDIDLLKNRRTASLHGTIRPFNIRLLGKRLDLVTVKFKGAEFTASTDSQPTYKAELLGVEIGGMLEFIKALQSFFAPKPGNGPYFGVTLFPPEAVAGYRYSAPLITVGTLFILNVAIDVSMHLPFDNRQATFRFAFASRNLPFLISSPPYGGGGFVALLATAKGIIGFEIQFEFGAVVAIEFGPLSAQGRVTAGIYLMSGEDTRVLEGFVCAVGEGNIACFGISVNIAVRVRQQDGGKMEGSSSYSFSFKAGFFEVSYSFSAQYTIRGGDGDSNRSLSRDGSGGGSGSNSEVRASGRRSKALVYGSTREESEQRITTKVPAKQSEWKRYRAHVAI